VRLPLACGLLDLGLEQPTQVDLLPVGELAAGEVEHAGVDALLGFREAGADDGGAVDAELVGDPFAVVTVEDVALLVDLDGDLDTAVGDVGAEALEVFLGEGGQQLVAVGRRWHVNNRAIPVARPSTG